MSPGAACLLVVALARAGLPSLTASGEPRAVTPVNVMWGATAPEAAGIEAWAAGRHRTALAFFEAAARANPSDPVNWHNLCVALYTASRFTEALGVFGLERSHAPTAPSSHLGAGRCLLALNRPAEAENEFAVAVIEAPTEQAGWTWLSLARTRQGKTALARATVRASATVRPRRRRTGWSAATINRAIARADRLAMPVATTFRAPRY